MAQHQSKMAKCQRQSTDGKSRAAGGNVTDPMGPVTLAPPLTAAEMTAVRVRLTLDLVLPMSLGVAMGVPMANLESGHNSGSGNGVGVRNFHI
jgi:hypothetical protein